MRVFLGLLVIAGAALLLHAQAGSINIQGTPGTTITIEPTPQPTWVSDPSAGHYDCPEGWTAYVAAEPSKFSEGGIMTLGMYIRPPLDAKGHVLASRPSPAICVQDKQFIPRWPRLRP